MAPSAGPSADPAGLRAPELASYNRGMRPTLRESLEDYPAVMLEAVAEGWGLSLLDEQLPETVERLVSEMTDPAALERMTSQLSRDERQALSYVAALGEVKRHVMARKYGRIRRLGPGRLEWERAWREPTSAAERLWFLGLIHRGYRKDEQYHGEVYYVPEEIREALPALEVVWPVPSLKRTPRPPDVLEDGDALARDAFVFLSHVRNHDVREKRGVLSRHELARIRARLSSLEAPRLQFLQHLCERSELLCREAGIWQPTRHAAAWLKLEPLSRQRLLFSSWLDDGSWNDLLHVPSLNCEDTGWGNDPVLARQAVVTWLREAPPGIWLCTESLLTTVRDLEPDFARPDGDYESWYIRDATSGQYLTGFHHWDMVEGAYIRYLLGHPLRWLGVTNVSAGDIPGFPSSFQVTADGAELLAARSSERERVGRRPGALQGTRHVDVEPDGRLLISLDASWYDRFILERFSEWLRERNRVAEYRMTQQTVRKAAAEGIRARQVEAFLRHVTGDCLPSKLRRNIHLWSQLD
jgi:hypothetical protein